MILEVGDRVRINHYWRGVNQYDQQKKMGIDDLEEYLRSEEMQGDTVTFDKYTKTSINEIGYIAGKRTIKVKYALWHFYEDTIGSDRIEQESAKYEEIYLVATRMNCLRRVSFEDIQYLGGE